MVGRREVNLVRPACERRHERDPPLVAQHGPHSVPLPLDDVAVKTPTGLPHVPRLRRKLALQHWRDKWIRVDLPVGMAQCYPYLFTAIFENVDVLHAVAAA